MTGVQTCALPICELETLKSLIGTANAQFQQLRGVTEQNAQRYYAIVAAVSARLQISTAFSGVKAIFG